MWHFICCRELLGFFSWSLVPLILMTMNHRIKTQLTLWTTPSSSLSSLSLLSMPSLEVSGSRIQRTEFPPVQLFHYSLHCNKLINCLTAVLVSSVSASSKRTRVFSVQRDAGLVWVPLVWPHWSKCPDFSIFQWSLGWFSLSAAWWGLSCRALPPECWWRHWRGCRCPPCWGCCGRGRSPAAV